MTLSFIAPNHFNTELWLVSGDLEVVGLGFCGLNDVTFGLGAWELKFSEVQSFEWTLPEYSKFQAKNFPCLNSQACDEAL